MGVTRHRIATNASYSAAVDPGLCGVQVVRHCLRIATDRSDQAVGGVVGVRDRRPRGPVADLRDAWPAPHGRIGMHELPANGRSGRERPALTIAGNGVDGLEQWALHNERCAERVNRESCRVAGWRENRQADTVRRDLGRGRGGRPVPGRRVDQVRGFQGAVPRA